MSDAAVDKLLGFASSLLVGYMWGVLIEIGIGVLIIGGFLWFTRQRKEKRRKRWSR